MSLLRVLQISTPVMSKHVNCRQRGTREGNGGLVLPIVIVAVLCVRSRTTVNNGIEIYSAHGTQVRGKKREQVTDKQKDATDGRQTDGMPVEE